MGGKALWKPWEATEDNFFPVPLLMAFPNYHPNPHPNLLPSATHPGASDFLTLWQWCRAGGSAAPVYLEDGEGRRAQSHLQVAMPGPGPAGAIPAPARARDSSVPCVAFVAEEPLCNMFYLGGLCPKLNLTPVASCLIFVEQLES